MRNLIEHLEISELPNLIKTTVSKEATEGFLKFILNNPSFKAFLDEMTYVNDSCLFSLPERPIETSLAICHCCVHKLLNEEGFESYYYEMCGRILMERREPIAHVLSGAMDTYFTVKASNYAVNLRAIH